MRVTTRVSKNWRQVAALLTIFAAIAIGIPAETQLNWSQIKTSAPGIFTSNANHFPFSLILNHCTPAVETQPGGEKRSLTWLHNLPSSALIHQSSGVAGYAINNSSAAFRGSWKNLSAYTYALFE
jgi:hypothetical protein